MLRVFHINVYALFDLRETLYFVTLYTVVDFCVSPKMFSEPFSVFTPIDDSVIAKWVCINCLVIISQKITLLDLVELDMPNFDVIFDMD